MPDAEAVADEPVVKDLPKAKPDPVFTTVACPKCGGQRPKEEIDHKACGNCVDLDLRKKATEEADANKEAQEKEMADLNEKLKTLPDLDKASTSLYDNDKGVVWVGFNLKAESANPVSLLLLLSQVQLPLLAYFADWSKRQEVKRKIILPRANRAIKETFEGLTKKAAAVPDKLKALFRTDLKDI